MRICARETGARLACRRPVFPQETRTLSGAPRLRLIQRTVLQKGRRARQERAHVQVRSRVTLLPRRLLVPECRLSHEELGALHERTLRLWPVRGACASHGRRRRGERVLSLEGGL